MNERFAVSTLSLVALVSLWVAPWAAINRETGARSALLLLPNRIIDFTGRTEAILIPAAGVVLVLSIILLAAVAIAGFLKGRTGQFIWIMTGLGLIFTVAWGWSQLSGELTQARLGLIDEQIARAIENPRGNVDVGALGALRPEVPNLTVGGALDRARTAGLNIRRLSYDDAGIGLAAFLSLLAGALALLFGLRINARYDRFLNRVLPTVAVPATSIFLALVAAAVVILALQPTALGRDVTLDGPFVNLVGRLDTLWYANVTLFADSLGTINGVAESLKFATPLIFTGLAVAFGFQAGLFNIGAPGQMVLGALGAMMVGVYMPGPRIIVLPLAVLAAALGGGIWGAIPGWLKARFGAHEVINTILMNFIASSLLLFVLSANPTFAAPALRIIYFLGALALLLILLGLIPWIRRQFGRAPRVAFAIIGVLALVGMIGFGLPQPGDAPVVLDLPFKAPGSDPKSYPLKEAARLSQLPAVVGIDLEASPGVNVIPVNYAALLAPLAALLALWLLPRFQRFRSWGLRLIGALVIGAVVYGVAALVGLAAVDTAIPPTRLNTSFILALATAIFMQYLMWRTKWGYELRAVGVAPKAAEYGGANISWNIILAMTVSGAFAGLTACHYVLGGALEEYALKQALPTADGFDGIAVALLGGNTPIGVVLSAFLFGVLKNGGSVLNITFTDLTRDVVSMILALVVLFIAAKGFLPERITDPVRRAARQRNVESETNVAGGYPEVPESRQAKGGTD